MFETRSAVATRPLAVAEAGEPAREHAVRRILHLAKHCGYGNGNVHVAVDLACAQADRGCDVTFLSGGGTFVPMLEKHGVRHVAFAQNLNSPLSFLRALKTVTRAVRDSQAEVLHAHMMGSAVLAWVAKFQTGTPVVTTVHNSFDPHSRIMRLGTKVVAVSEAERQHLIRQGYPARRLEVVMNAPVNSPREEFMAAAPNMELKCPYIVTVCGLHKRKGVADLVMACSKVFPFVPDWMLVIAGEGPDRGALEQLAEGCGIRDRVRFLGFIENPREIMSKSEIFTLCSYADPCSLVIGEACGAGCAIVASAVGGTPEMLNFGEAGRLFQPGNVDQLACELRALMLDTSERTRLKAASRAGAHRFDVTRLFYDYDSVYQKALCC